MYYLFALAKTNKLRNQRQSYAQRRAPAVPFQFISVIFLRDKLIRASNNQLQIASCLSSLVDVPYSRRSRQISKHQEKVYDMRPAKNRPRNDQTYRREMYLFS